MNTKTIEKLDDRWWVVEHGEYEASSVLHGMTRRTLLESYETETEASNAAPDALIVEGTTEPYQPEDQSLADLSGLPSCPPDWFDPSDAGEWWDDDY